MGIKRTGIPIVFLVISINLMAQPVCRVSDFGAAGDGRTNDLIALRRVASHVSQQGGGTVVFEPGKTYYVKLDEVDDERPVKGAQDNATIMGFKDCNTVSVVMNGATIFLAPNHRVEYVFFHFLNCKSFSLSGGSLIGDALRHDYSDIVRYGKLQKSTHEWGYGILVNGAKGIIKDMDISYMTGDGIKSGSIAFKNKGTFHADVTIENTEISYCRRNGISVLSSLGTAITNVNIHHIGSSDKLTGTSPEAGIDLEYEDGVGDTGDITIRNCRITDCRQKVISASNTTPPTPRNLLIDNCYLDGSRFQIANTQPVSSMAVRNCTIVNCPIHLGKAVVTKTSFTLRQSVNYVSGGDYRDCSFQGLLDGFTSVYGCSIAGTNLDEALFTDCTFSDIRAANNNSPAYQGFSAYNFPLKAVFKRCVFKNCSFVRGNPKYASSFEFFDSELSDGCMIYNENDDIPVSFSNCTLTDVSSYKTQKGRFELIGSSVFQKDTSVAQPLLLFGDINLVKCTVTDYVGAPESSMKRNGVKSYKIKASRTTFIFLSEKPVTNGISLKGGRVKGVSKQSFKGEHRSVKFR